jgi:hypothetical protein
MFPSKTNPPLAVNSDTELTSPVPAELFKPVGGRNSQVFKSLRTFDKQQLPQRQPFNRSKTSRALSAKYPLSLSASKAVNHADCS